MSLDRKKFDALVKRIQSGKYWTPKVGEYVYMETEFYISHGEDDVVGGLGTVTEVGTAGFGGDDPFIRVAERDSASRWNWAVLFEEQKELMEFFGESFSFPDPDFG